VVIAFFEGKINEYYKLSLIHDSGVIHSTPTVDTTSKSQAAEPWIQKPLQEEDHLLLMVTYQVVLYVFLDQHSFQPIGFGLDFRETGVGQWNWKHWPI